MIIGNLVVIKTLSAEIAIEETSRLSGHPLFLDADAVRQRNLYASLTDTTGAKDHIQTDWGAAFSTTIGRQSGFGFDGDK